MKLNEIIQNFGLKEDANDPRWKEDQNKQVFRGSVYTAGTPFAEWCDFDELLKADGFDPDKPNLPGWQCVEVWSSLPYRAVWISVDQKATFTYCEGDLILVLLGDNVSFRQELDEAGEFYGDPITVLFDETASV